MNVLPTSSFQELTNCLRDRGIHFSPELIDPANTAKTRIYFFDADRPVKNLQPTSELFKDYGAWKRTRR
jgi:hypothetical protein